MKKIEREESHREGSPLPGIPFLREVCACVRCGRLVTATSSVERGAGQKCWEHLHGESAYARLEAQGQTAFWPREVRE